MTLQRFVWAPSGEYLYFEGVSRRGAESLARDRGASDAEVGCGPRPSDRRRRRRYGHRDFRGRQEDRARHTPGAYARLVLPFDPISGQLKGEARPETRDGIDAWWFDVTRDGRQLVFMTRRADKTELNVSRDIPKSELWKQSLTDGREALLAPADEFFRLNPNVSPDGTHLTYLRLRASGVQWEIDDPSGPGWS